LLKAKADVDSANLENAKKGNITAAQRMDKIWEEQKLENLKNEMIDAMMFIWRANSVHDKQGHIHSAREKIEKCRLYIRLLYDLRQISLEHFTKWNIAIQSISKQLAGWDKSQKGESELGIKN